MILAWFKTKAQNILKSIRCVLSHFSHVQLSETLWTVAWQAPLSIGFSRQEYWSGSPCPPPGDLPIQGSNPRQLSLLYWQVGFPVGLSGKEPPAMRETWVQSLGWGLYNLGLDYIVCGVAKSWIWLSDFHCSLPLAPPGKPQKYIIYI